MSPQHVTAREHIQLPTASLATVPGLWVIGLLDVRWEDDDKVTGTLSDSIWHSSTTHRVPGDLQSEGSWKGSGIAARPAALAQMQRE